MMLLRHAPQMTKSESIGLIVGLILIMCSIVGHAALVRADDVSVSVTIPPTGSLIITVFSEDNTQTPSSQINFDNVMTSDIGLFERSAETGKSDLEITVQTNNEAWLLTQHIGSGHLTNESGRSINMLWKRDDQSSYQMIGSPEAPDLVADHVSSQGSSVDLDYALDVPTDTSPGTYNGTLTYTLSYN